ncbi:MAG: primosomal protein N' (replication factor Y) - superfamily II helicase [Rhodobacteraceae bacterium]|nr:MAG: primosomal protein N' (replication factor Y) - superfamily II helicase [Paracoccaceae bacterium]
MTPPDDGPWGPARADAPAPAATQYPCAACGAAVSYRPGETVLHCPFCGSDTPIPDVDDIARREAVREHDFHAALERGVLDAEMETTQVVHCDSCGATVEFDPAEHARECPFCATPLVADSAADRHIKPQAVLPFAIDGDEARRAVARWRASLWFAPNGLKRYARERGRLSGVYTPYWTFDAQTETAYAGERGDAHSVRTRGPDGKPRLMTQIRWRRASGRVRRAFDDVLVLGATSLPRAYTDALAPWDLSQLKPYARDWLAGFRAEAYTVGLREAFGVARGVMDAQIRADVRAAIGGHQQRIHRLDTRVSDVTFKHVLLPVYVGAYRYRDRAYRVVVNGRTGAVRGERPWSAWKIALAALAALALAAAVLAIDQSGGFR